VLHGMPSAWYLLGVIPVLMACSASDEASYQPGRISTADVGRFVGVLERLQPGDTSCVGLGAYYDNASPGLLTYRRKFDVTLSDLCLALRRSPERYAALAGKLSALDSAAARIDALFDRFRALYSGAQLPEVYFLVGNGVSAGSATHGRRPRVLIGMERNREVETLPGLLAHEFVHSMQDYAFWGSANGGPQFIRGPLLRHAIAEGSADFIAELVTGIPKRNAYAELHEAELWREFWRDRHTRDYRRWLYNGWNSEAMGERPPDLGYWIGYRITKAYYGQAQDKTRALREILSIRDFDRFLAKSGYTGG
jgi:predicted Zn-dependent protease DUF2268